MFEEVFRSLQEPVYEQGCQLGATKLASVGSGISFLVISISCKLILTYTLDRKIWENPHCTRAAHVGKYTTIERAAAVLNEL